jgi:hypothetical protein
MMMEKRLARAIGLTNALAGEVDAARLEARDGTSPSNTIGGQFWCLIGARESYARAIEAGRWSGFRCSLGQEGARDPAQVRAALAASGKALVELLGSLGAGASEAQVELAFDLLEHEAQHHGQLIRFFYANRIGFPEAFAKRYALK